jgi:hypothetical protein
MYWNFVAIDGVIKSQLDTKLKLRCPSDCRLSVKLVPTFADRKCHVVSVTDPFFCILGFLDRHICIQALLTLQLCVRRITQCCALIWIQGTVAWCVCQMVGYSESCALNWIQGTVAWCVCQMAGYSESSATFTVLWRADNTFSRIYLKAVITVFSAYSVFL